MDVYGFAGSKLCKKLQGFKKNIEVRNREVFGKINSTSDALAKEVEGWDRSEEIKTLLLEEINARRRRGIRMQDFFIWWLLQDKG